MPTVISNVQQPPDHKGTDSADTPQDSLAMQDGTKQPIWEVIVEIGAQIPEEEWAKVPTDASINYKHYLYSAPKKKA
jgi:hypothetical protein